MLKRNSIRTDEERKRDMMNQRYNYSLSLRKQKISEYINKKRMNKKNRINVYNPKNPLIDLTNKRELYSKDNLERFNNYLNMFLKTSNIKELYEYLQIIKDILSQIPEICCKVFYQAIIISGSMKYMIDLIDYCYPPLRNIIFNILSSISYESEFTELLFLNKVNYKITQIIKEDNSINENELKDMIYLITNISLDNKEFSQYILQNDYVNILLNYIPKIINNRQLLGISIWSFSSFIENNSKINKLISTEQLVQIYNIAINTIKSTPKEIYSNRTNGGNAFYFSIDIIYKITSKITSDKRCSKVINYPNDLETLNSIFNVVISLLENTKNLHLKNMGLKIINNFIFIDEEEIFQSYLINNSFINILSELLNENKSNSISSMICCIIMNLSCSFSESISKNENLILTLLDLGKNSKDIIMRKNAFLSILGLCQNKNFEIIKLLVNNGLIDIIYNLMNICQNEFTIIQYCLQGIVKIIETFQDSFEYIKEIINILNKKGMLEYIEKLIYEKNNNNILQMSEYILEKKKMYIEEVYCLNY